MFQRSSGVQLNKTFLVNYFQWISWFSPLNWSEWFVLKSLLTRSLAHSLTHSLIDGVAAVSKNPEMFSILIIFKNVINQHISMISEDHVTSYDWRKFSFAITENAPVTIVTSVPWEQGQDITENSPLWELLPFLTFLMSFWLTPVQMTGQLSRSMQLTCKYWQAERQYKCGECDNYVRIWYWTLLSWWSSEHGELKMSRSRSQGTEVTIVTGAFSLAFTRHHREFSIMGTIFNPVYPNMD